MSSRVPHFPGENSPVVEVALLLSRGDADALSAAASREGLTAAQLIRHLIRSYTGDNAAPCHGPLN